MVEHSGRIETTFKAIEAVDESVGEVFEKSLDMEGNAIITAD
ncbi:hypothetical protein, partial [Staphylococcus aureus]